MFTLRYLEQDAERQHRLVEGDTSVGRSPGCVLVIDDPTLSRRHAVFQHRESALTVRDAGSNNGTYLNDRAVTEAEVHPGDVVRLGQLLITVAAAEEDVDATPPSSDSLSPDTFLRSVTDVPGTVGARSTSVSADRLLALLGDISRTLVQSDALEDILGRVTELVFGAVSAERCVLLLRDHGDAPLVARVSQNRDGTPHPDPTISRTVCEPSDRCGPFEAVR